MSRLNSGRQVTAVPRKTIQHARERLVAYRIRQQVEMESQCVSSLRVALDFSVILHVGAIELGLNTIKKPAIVLCVIVAIERDRHFRHEFRRVREKCGSENLLGYSATQFGPAFENQCIGVEPIVIVVAPRAFPEQVRFFALDEIHPPPGGIKMLREEPPIGVVLVHAPRDHCAGVAPRWRAEELLALQDAVWIGREVGKPAVRQLIVRNILQPFGQKCRHVHIENGGLRKCLNIAHPAKALISLRAVGRNAEQIGPLRPKNIVHQLINVWT